jgi:DNA-directed RNA polymerase specialized sigma24 family protein
MSVDRRSLDPEESAGKSPIQQLVEAFRRRDPDEFKKLVCHLERPLVAYLYWRHGPSWERACELAHDTIETACTSLRSGKNPKDPWPWLLGIANNHLEDRHVGKELPVQITDFNPVPDRHALNTFAKANTDLERQQVVWRNLPVFLELMHDAIDRMPTELAQVIGTLGALVEDDALGFDPHSDTIDALVGRLDLDHAEVSRINEALETFQQIAAALLTARIGPSKQNVDTSALV